MNHQVKRDMRIREYKMITLTSRNPCKKKRFKSTTGSNTFRCQVSNLLFTFTCQVSNLLFTIHKNKLCSISFLLQLTFLFLLTAEAEHALWICIAWVDTLTAASIVFATFVIIVSLTASFVLSNTSTKTRISFSYYNVESSRIIWDTSS